MRRVFVNGRPAKHVTVKDGQVTLRPGTQLEVGVWHQVMVVDRPWWSFARDSLVYWLWYRWRP